MTSQKQTDSDHYIYQPSRFYRWFCVRTERNLGELKITQNEWLGLVQDYVSHRRQQFNDRLLAYSLRARKKRRLKNDKNNQKQPGEEKRPYRISKRGIIFQTPMGWIEPLNRLYSAECAWVILCGEAKALENISRNELSRRLKERYPFLPQTKRETFVEEVRSESPRTLAQKELAEYLQVKFDSIPVLLSPSQWPRSEPKWLADLANKHHPAEFDLPIRLRHHRRRRK